MHCNCIAKKSDPCRCEPAKGFDVSNKVVCCQASLAEEIATLETCDACRINKLSAEIRRICSSDPKPSNFPLARSMFGCMTVEPSQARRRHGRKGMHLRFLAQRLFLRAVRVCGCICCGNAPNRMFWHVRSCTV